MLEKTAGVISSPKGVATVHEFNRQLRSLPLFSEPPRLKRMPRIRTHPQIPCFTYSAAIETVQNSHRLPFVLA
jgi:hypothetical protein